jgi:hypothetical protein
MISAPVEPQRWPRRRWWFAVALMLALQAMLVFLAEERSLPVPRQPVSAPLIRLSAGAPSELLALYDPTLFALPQREGFSGEAWLKSIPSLEFRPPDWTEPPRWLQLSADPLGAGFKDFLRANVSPPFPTIVAREPRSSAPELFPTGPVSTASTLRIEGGLAKRRLLSRPELPAWTNTDVLANSVVQLLVDAQGNTFSAVVLPPGSGLNDADQCALETAKAARFNAVEPTGPGRAKNPAAELTPGRMIFEWQTRFAKSTNTPPEIP